MKVLTLKQYAEEQKITYEAVRKQVVRYSEELSGHVIRKNRTQYLDEFAVNFLSERRRESPVVLVTQDQGERIEELTNQLEHLKSKLMEVQTELLKAQDRIISLQDEAKSMIEAKAKYQGLLEAHTAQSEKLQAAEERVEASRVELAAVKAEIEELRSNSENEKAQLRQDLEADRIRMEELVKERDEAQAEAQSFQKSFFGFYRKK